jgi:hypothetical protein
MCVINYPYLESNLDIVVEAVKDSFQQLWRLVDPCSPPRIGGEHGKVHEKREIKLFEQHCCLCLQCFEDLFDQIVIW